MKPNYVYLFISIFAFCQGSSADELPNNQPKSPGNATAISLASTFIPSILAIPFVSRDIPESDWNEIAGVSLLGSGVLFGPGIGYLYAHDGKSFYKGVLVRAIGGGLILAGVAKTESIFERDTMGEALILSGGTIILISLIKDIAKVDGSARRYNKVNGLISGVYPNFSFGPNKAHIGLSILL